MTKAIQTGAEPAIQSNEAVLNIVRRLIDQHQSIIDANAKLLDVLGYPVVLVKPIDDELLKRAARDARIFPYPEGEMPR